MIWVRVHGSPVRQFYPDENNLAALDMRQAHHPLLEDVGVLRSGTRGEVANVSVELRNDNGQMSVLFQVPPLAARVTIYDDDEPVFTGTVAGVRLDSRCTIEVEA